MPQTDCLTVVEVMCIFLIKKLIYLTLLTELFVKSSFYVLIHFFRFTKQKTSVFARSSVIYPAPALVRWINALTLEGKIHPFLYNLNKEICNLRT